MSDTHTSKDAFENFPQKLPQEFETASQVLERLLNNTVFQHGKPEHPQFTTAKVQVRTGLPGSSDSLFSINTTDLDNLKNARESLQFVITDPHIAVMPAKYLEFVVNDVIKKIPALKQHAELETTEEHCKRVVAEMSALNAVGANIPDSIKNWSGFNPELAEMWSEIKDHGFEVSDWRSSTGVRLDIEIPSIPGKTDGKIASKVEENIKSRKDEFLGALADQVVHYKGISDPAEQTKLREEIKALEIEFDSREDTRKTGGYGSPRVNLTLRTKEQAEYSKKGNQEKLAPKTDEELEKMNPLQGLSPEQMGKAFGKALYRTGGEKGMELLTLIGGREDIKREIEKKVDAFKEAHKSEAELVKKADDFLKDPMFDNKRTWFQAPSERREKEKDRKAPPSIKADPKHPGEMIVEFDLPRDKAWEVIQSVAAMNGQTQAPVQAPITATPSAGTMTISAVPGTVETIAQNIVATIGELNRMVDAGVQAGAAPVAAAVTAVVPEVLAAPAKLPGTVQAKIVAQDINDKLDATQKELDSTKALIQKGIEVFEGEHGSIEDLTVKPKPQAKADCGCKKAKEILAQPRPESLAEQVKQTQGTGFSLAV